MTEEKKKISISGDLGGSRQVSLPTNLPSNRNKDKSLDPKKTSAPQERIKLERITTQDVIRKRQTWWSKFGDAIKGDDAQSVGAYLFNDVFIPALKDLIVDGASQGIERLVRGSSSSRSAPRSNERRTPYGKMSMSRPLENSSGRRELSSQDRANHNFDNIVVGSRAESEEILDRLSMNVEEYGNTRVTDLYELVGISGSFTDDRWGWTSMRESGIRRVRDGYLLLLPRPEPLE